MGCWEVAAAAVLGVCSCEWVRCCEGEAGQGVLALRCWASGGEVRHAVRWKSEVVVRAVGVRIAEAASGK